MTCCMPSKLWSLLQDLKEVRSLMFIRAGGGSMDVKLHDVSSFTVVCSVTWPLNGSEAGVTLF